LRPFFVLAFGHGLLETLRGGVFTAGIGYMMLWPLLELTKRDKYESRVF